MTTTIVFTSTITSTLAITIETTRVIVRTTAMAITI